MKNNIYLENNPIVAIATATGYGGIGIVRMSLGYVSNIYSIIENIMISLTGKILLPRQAYYVPFYDTENNEILDHGIALYFPAPFSYTGESILELQGHGGPIITQLILRSCIFAGRDYNFRLADPGEFTRRAFLNNKIDLIQAESVVDLIKASTENAARSAIRSLEGMFSKNVNKLVKSLINVRSLVETTLDFPEEYFDNDKIKKINDQLKDIMHRLTKLNTEANYGVLLNEGLIVVLAGQPNVGKSSLLNILAGNELAIVTSTPGTTRDSIEKTIQISGIPLKIIDTAGLCDTTDEIEKLGVARAWKIINTADIILHVIDYSCIKDKRNFLNVNVKSFNTLNTINNNIAIRFPKQALVIRIFNKIDLVNGCQSSRNFINKDSIIEEIYLSAKTNNGISLLYDALLNTIKSRSNINNIENIFNARERHINCLTSAIQYIKSAIDYSTNFEKNAELLAEELHSAQLQLNKITGSFNNDDLLNVIFSQFCIGK